MRVADYRLHKILNLRAEVQARQATADELHDQDTVLICNMLQDRLNELMCKGYTQADGTETLAIRPRQADEDSYIHYTLSFVNGVLNMDKWSDQINRGDYFGLYLPQAQQQLQMDLRNILEAA